MFRTLSFDAQRFEAELAHDFLLATELADHLAAKGVPFRDAHHVAGRVVGWCEQQGGDFSVLDLATLSGFHPALGEEALALLADPRGAADRRTSFGGTAWSEVLRQVEELRAS